MILIARWLEASHKQRRMSRPSWHSGSGVLCYVFACMPTRGRLVVVRKWRHVMQQCMRQLLITCLVNASWHLLHS